MNIYIVNYLLYLAVSTGICLWAGHVLFKNGRVFLEDIFHGQKALAEAVDNMLLVGYYLLNIGYAVYSMMITSQLENYRQMMEVLSRKLGFILLLLGVMHFLNMWVLYKLRNRETYRM